MDGRVSGMAKIRVCPVSPPNLPVIFLLLLCDAYACVFDFFGILLGETYFVYFCSSLSCRLDFFGKKRNEKKVRGNLVQKKCVSQSLFLFFPGLFFVVCTNCERMR